MGNDGYDPKKDKTLWQKGVEITEERSIIVSVKQYGGGQPKVGLICKIVEPDSGKVFWTNKIGRLDTSVVSDLIEALEESRDFIQG